MLNQICAEIRNYFLHNRQEDIHVGKFNISNGHIESLPFLQAGQYFRIVGSVFNDGVWQYPAIGLADETFTGAVWAMYVPLEFVNLCSEIQAWVENNANVIASPYASESFGGYSYSKASYGSDGGLTWQGQFATRLNPYRRISVL